MGRRDVGTDWRYGRQNDDVRHIKTSWMFVFFLDGYPLIFRVGEETKRMGQKHKPPPLLLLLVWVDTVPEPFRT
jgi:hypothetical protein